MAIKQPFPLIKVIYAKFGIAPTEKSVSSGHHLCDTEPIVINVINLKTIGYKEL